MEWKLMWKKKTKVMGIPRQQSPIQMTDQNRLENFEYFKYFGNMITIYVRYTLEIKSRLAMTIAAFNQ
jgi:hypothetical protein